MSSTPRARLRRTLQTLTAALLAASVLTACGTVAPKDQKAGAAAVVEKDEDGLNGTLVDPPLQLADVTLRDTGGTPVRLNEFALSAATVLFFGFTHCDDVCPTTMADLASARRALPPGLANRVHVVFVTVDPRRDTASVLRTWLDQFDTDTVGLRGPTSVVNRAERSLYADQSTKAEGRALGGAAGSGRSSARAHWLFRHERECDYEVNHSGSVYVFGPQGETVLYSGGTTVASTPLTSPDCWGP